LLIPLASLVRLRLVKYESPQHMVVNSSKSWQVQRQDFTASMHLFFPIVTVLLASVLILVCAILRMAETTVGVGWRGLIPPLAVSFGLLLVVIARQEIAFLEHAQMRNERAAARTDELARRELDRHKNELLTMLTHELR